MHFGMFRHFSIFTSQSLLRVLLNKVYFQYTASFQERWHAKATHQASDLVFSSFMTLKELPADTLPAHLPSEHQIQPLKDLALCPRQHQERLRRTRDRSAQEHER